MNVSEYISNTRTLSDTRPSLDLYSKYYSYVRDALDGKFHLPELEIVYSLQRTSEIVNLDGKTYLIYVNILVKP